MKSLELYRRIAGIILVPLSIFGWGSGVRAWANRRRGVGVSRRATVGFMTFIDQPVTASEPRVVIEEGARIGFHNIIFSHDTSVERRGNGSGDEFGRVLVKKGAETGPCVTVLKDVTIGEGAFVEACSLVAKDVPANAVVRGVPARQVGWLEDDGKGIRKFRPI